MTYRLLDLAIMVHRETGQARIIHLMTMFPV